MKAVGEQAMKMPADKMNIQCRENNELMVSNVGNSRKPEVRSQKSEVGSRKSEVRSGESPTALKFGRRSAISKFEQPNFEISQFQNFKIPSASFLRSQPSFRNFVAAGKQVIII